MISVFSFGKLFFWVTNYSDILYLKNKYRFEGNLINISDYFKEKNFILELNYQEIFLGIELGFLKLKRINFKAKKDFLNILKKFSPPETSNSRSVDHSKTDRKNFFVKRWREVLVVLKDCIKKKNKSFFSNSKKKFILKKKINLKSFLPALTNLKFENILIFRDLWQKGFIINNGIKFGSLYTVYSGNIKFFHSYASVISLNCFSWFYPIDLISLGRVGTSTKKRTLIVFLSEQFFLKYFTIKWLNDLP